MCEEKASRKEDFGHHTSSKGKKKKRCSVLCRFLKGGKKREKWLQAHHHGSRRFYGSAEKEYGNCTRRKIEYLKKKKALLTF